MAESATAMNDKQRMFIMVTIKNIALSCAAAAAMAVSVPAVAGVKTKPVYHHDLDLSSANGQERLQTRIKNAVTQVCGSPRAFSLQEKADVAQCEAEATSAATPKVARTIARYQDRKRLAVNENTAIVGN
jgi:UrcA family protein